MFSNKEMKDFLLFVIQQMIGLLENIISRNKVNSLSFNHVYY